jgi:excisionase family DNA binding protein
MNNESIAPADDQLHDLNTIASRLNVATKTVRRMIARGELGYHQVGRLKRVSDSQYLEYLSGVRRSNRGRST